MRQNNGSRREVIDRLVTYVIERLPKEEAPLLKSFISQYFLSVSAEDLTSRSMLDLYGAVLSHWNFISHRKPDECKIRVYNPNFEEHGWQSTHTIIEIAYLDKPFLVDSISMELARLGLSMHLVIHLGGLRLRRGLDGKITDVLEQKTTLEDKPEETDILNEMTLYIETDRQTDPAALDKITESLRQVVNDVNRVVEDWRPMYAAVLKTIEELKEVSLKSSGEVEINEIIEFLKWIADDHFTLTGFAEYRFIEQNQAKSFQAVPETCLGLSKMADIYAPEFHLSEFPPETQNVVLSKEQILLLGKASFKSRVHRPAYTDFIVIKFFDAEGNIIKAYRFAGLYTAVAYNNSPKQIPFLRYKVNTIVQKAGFPPRGHDERALINILETLPRDDLFEGSIDDLLSLSTDILHIQERQKIRLFIRKDTYARFFSCLVFIPRERFNSQLRTRIQSILLEALQGYEVSFETRFSESLLARIHLIIRIHPLTPVVYDTKDLENKLIEVSRSWREDLRDAIIGQSGESKGNELLKRYSNAFPASYRESFTPKVALVDIEYFENLSDKNILGLSLYKPLEETEDAIRFKLIRIGATIPLSDVVPIFEHMGLKVISERPYEITPKERPSIWINDYRMIHPMGQPLNIESFKEIFQEAFSKIWHDEAEDDGFNRLVFSAQLNWREISLLRAYAKYFWQVGFTFSQSYIEDTLNTNATIAKDLILLFELRFNPDHRSTDVEINEQKTKIESALENVLNLDQDRILRRYLQAVMSTLRTNYFHRTPQGDPKPYISFKLDSCKMPEMPLPVPKYEIYVYSPRVEGIHLRADKVARGGIRWSDRKEDFRTEILGLMKAQQVKNAVIVPMGAKGGFVVKHLIEQITREKAMEEVVFCYETLIRGLLDLTDNSKGDNIVTPGRTVRYDDLDPYLVVAADKGTATFSDLANTLSKEYDFWLDDAFASGGSTGYDHKKMGITARGGWESVKRHFQEMGVDILNNNFTVVGIGDMSGDVFGNAMIISNRIKLIAAFDHRHIFLDPNPDPEISYKERRRLFELPRSSWADYDAALISEGGGVFPKSAKSIPLSSQVKEALHIDTTSEKLTPNELIKAILKAPTDLLWNGGIGTFVKSSHESNLAVGDRANDAIRVNGKDLRYKVVGEGGNLGFTQLGRIEYAQQGGRINTDAIDNSGGVNCSDNEVNIKILLNGVVVAGDLTEKQRNELLRSMENEVAELVLKNNRLQTEAISVAVAQAAENLEMYIRVLDEMEKEGNIDRAVEFLPDQAEVAARKAAGKGLTRPEIAVLMAYSKTLLKKALLESSVPREPYFDKYLSQAFPQVLSEKFKPYMEKHRLRNEIIATQISNAVINEMGISFVYRLQDETDGEPADIVRAYTVSREIYGAEDLHNQIRTLGTSVNSNTQFSMIHEVNRLIRRGTRWFLRNRRTGFDITETIELFAPKLTEIIAHLPHMLQKGSGSVVVIERDLEDLMQKGIPEALAYRMSITGALYSALDIIEAATQNNFPVDKLAFLYFAVGSKLELGWFREQIKIHSINNHWEALARASFRDDIDKYQRNITVAIMQANGDNFENTDALIESWIKKHQALLRRWTNFMTELKGIQTPEYMMFSVALGELQEMAEASVAAGKVQ